MRGIVVRKARACQTDNLKNGIYLNFV